MISEEKRMNHSQIKLNIVQGAVDVNSGAIVNQSEDIVCIVIDLRTKRAECNSYFTDIDNGLSVPGVMLVSNENTIHLNCNHDANAPTLVYFPQFADSAGSWSVFMAEVTRYTLKVVLTKTR